MEIPPEKCQDYLMLIKKARGRESSKIVRCGPALRCGKLTGLFGKS